jgi:hypothetical protein
VAFYFSLLYEFFIFRYSTGEIEGSCPVHEKATELSPPSVCLSVNLIQIRATNGGQASIPPSPSLCKPFLEQIFRIRIHFTGIINEDRPDRPQPDSTSGYKSCYIKNVLSASFLGSVNGRHGGGGGNYWL